MKRDLEKIGITVEIETEDCDCMGHIEFYPTGYETHTMVQTGNGGIKAIMSAVSELIQVSGLDSFYFETEGCLRRERIYKKFLSRHNISWCQDGDFINFKVALRLP